jgi:hypothetical protein
MSMASGWGLEGVVGRVDRPSDVSRTEAELGAAVDVVGFFGTLDATGSGVATSRLTRLSRNR